MRETETLDHVRLGTGRLRVEGLHIPTLGDVPWVLDAPKLDYFGFGQLRGYDVKLGEYCGMQPASDGGWECLPAADSHVELVYIEATCQKKNPYVMTGEAGHEPGTLFRGYAQQDADEFVGYFETTDLPSVKTQLYVRGEEDGHCTRIQGTHEASPVKAISTEILHLDVVERPLADKP